MVLCNLAIPHTQSRFGQKCAMTSDTALPRTIRALIAGLVGAAALASAHPLPAQISRDAVLAFVRGEQPQGRTTIVLVDVSGSITPDDRKLYRDSIASLGQTLAAGDRILVANIGNDTRSSFRPTLDLAVPPSKVKLERDRAQAAARAQLQRAMPNIVPETSTPANSTRILEAIAAAAEALPPPPRLTRHRILLLTDAVEESRIANFERAPLTDAHIHTILERARNDGLTPNLEAVDLHIIGVGGRHYEATRAFWQAYAKTTGATLRQYNRLRPEFGQ